jgi:hypothetical protein
MSFPGGTIPGGGGSLWAGGGGAGGGIINPVYLGRGILYPALRKAAITLGPQRTPSPAQYQDALEELNRLLGSLGCDRFFIYSRDRYVAPLSGSKTYTIGISADPNVIPDFDLPRPEVIEAANVISATDPAVRYSLAIVDELAWSKISVQDIGNTIPEVLYNDRAHPLSTLYLYGQPMAGYLLEMYVWHLIPQFLTPDDVVLLPPGYEDALVLNLALRLAPHFQRTTDPNLREDARVSLMRLMSINAPQPVADVSGGLGCGCNRYDVYSGQMK